MHPIAARAAKTRSGGHQARRVALALTAAVGLLIPAHGFLSSPASAVGRTYAGHWHAWPAFKDSARYGKVAPAGAAPGDYDGDGKVDLAVRTSTGAWAIDYAANGLSGVDAVAANNYPVTGVPAPADYDGDGKADIAVLADGVLSVDYAANGFNGVDASIAEGPAGATPVVADFDGDHRADLGLWGPDGVLRVDLAANGWGGTDLSASYGSVASLAAADVDGDGKADVAVLDSAGGLRIDSSGDGLGALGPSISGYPAGGQLALADADGDGKADVQVLDTDAGVWLVDVSADGLDPAAASTVTLDGFNFPGGRMAAADVDGDGKSDLTVLTAASRWLAELSTDPAPPVPVFTAKSTLLDSAGGEVDPAGAAAADYDGDGKVDLAARTTTGSWVIDLAANGIGGPDQVLAHNYPTGGSPAPADYDGDGKADIAVLADGVLSVDYAANGFNGVDAAIAEGPPGARPLTADFDGDGRTDLATLADDGTLRIDLAANGFGSVDRTVAYGAAAGPGAAVAAGDLDGDRQADVAVLDPSGGLRVDSSADGLGALGPSISGYPAGGQLALADADGDGKADVNVLAGTTWLVDSAADGLDPAASSTTRIEQFDAPGGRMAAVDVDGDGKADLTALARFAYPLAYAGDPAAAPQARWLVHAAAGTRHSLVGYWQGEGALAQILDDKQTDPAIGDFNLVHMAWGAASYGSASDTYVGSYLRDRIDKALAGGSQVVLDLTYLFLNHPDQLPNLRADLCPTTDSCRYVWLEVMDEPYGHGETPQVFNAQVEQLRAEFPEPQFKIVMVEGTGDAASPDKPCPAVTNPNTVYFWCWYQLDPADAIPKGVDILAFDVFRYDEYVKSYNDLRSITSKPLIGWAPSWWFCSPNTCPSFPVPKAAQIAGGDSAPPEDTLPFAEFGLEDPQLLGTAIFLYGRDPDRSLPATDPYGPNGLPHNQRQTYLRVQRSMMWVRNPARVPAIQPPHVDYPTVFHGTVLAPNPATSVVLNRFLTNGCRPDPTVQGTDGYVVEMGLTSAVDITASAVGATGYDVFLYDDTCHQVGTAVADPAGSVHLVPAPSPAHWAVVHLGLGAQLQFTLTRTP